MLSCSADSCNHGRCVNGSCVCDYGWTGHVDILTYDLSQWGGPVLTCAAHVLTVKLIWSSAGLFSVALLLFSILGVSQQWHTFKALQRQGVLKHWFQHLPLMILLLLCTMFLPTVLFLSTVKVTSPSLSETVGASALATAGSSGFTAQAPIVAGAHVLNVLSVPLKSLAIEDDIRLQSLLKATGAFTVIGCVFIFLSTVYPIVSATFSPLNHRHVHVLCFNLFFGQMSVSLLFVAFATAVMCVKVYAHLSKCIHSRKELEAQTPQMSSSLADLYRTRTNILASQLAMIVGGASQSLLHGLCVLKPELALQYSYYFPAHILVFLTIVASMINSLTRIPSRLQLSFKPSNAEQVSQPLDNGAGHGAHGAAVELEDLAAIQTATQSSGTQPANSVRRAADRRVEFAAANDQRDLRASESQGADAGQPQSESVAQFSEQRPPTQERQRILNGLEC